MARLARGDFRPDDAASAQTRSSVPGAHVDEASLPTGHDAIDRVLHEHFVQRKAESAILERRAWAKNQRYVGNPALGSGIGMRA